MKNSILILLTFTFGSVFIQLNAQTPEQLQQQARSLIQSRGLEEQEVRTRLQQRGIDIDNVSPEQIPQLQPQIEAVLTELEAEKNTAPAPTNNESPTTETQTPITNNQQPITNNPLPITDSQAPTKAEKVAEAVTRSNTQNLPASQIYGHQLFREKDVALFRTTNEVKPPDSYVLSTGDEITISIFGASQFDSKFTINKEGYINPTQLPKIFLKGLRLGQAKELLRSRFSNFYRFAPEQFAVSLTTARTITVNIFGETQNVGSFTISAINTAFNALVAAGGPTDLGTVRNIRVIRGKTTQTLDLYAFLSNPALQYNFFLEDNDILHVPVAERIVGISGAVRRPLRYELNGSENLVKLLEFAGGMNANAYREVIQLQRFVDDKKVLMDVDLKKLLAQKQDFALLDGDEIIVREIALPIENTASIEGAVELPGTYALDDTRRVSDLVKKGGLRRESRTDVAFLLRKNPDGTHRLVQLNLEKILTETGSPTDLELQRGDHLTVYATARYTDTYTISVNGAVREPLANHPYDPEQGITIQRAVLLAGGLQPEANGQAYILRTNPNNTKEKDYIPVNLQAALANPEGGNNYILQPGDAVQVLASTTFTDEYSIAVTGAVRTPSKLPYGASLSLRDAVLLSGGLQAEANGQGYIMRSNPSNSKLKDYLPVDLTAALANPLGRENLVLQPGDALQVLSSTVFTDVADVSVVGAVRTPGRFQFSPTLTLKDALTLSGGLKLEAARNRVDIYRVEIVANQPTRTLSISVEVDEQFNIIGGATDLALKPFDEIVVRSAPDFELQEYVELNGEVLYPGRYALLDDNETLSNLIRRAGGLTPEADAASATLFRAENNKGLVVTRLQDAMRRPRTPEDLILKKGDVVNVPKYDNLVAIRIANTRAFQMFQEKLISAGQINVAYARGRKAGYYVRHYAGGFDKNADRKKVSVRQPNGKINRTVNIWPFRFYPKVSAGAIVTVPVKPPKEKKEKKERKGVDWDKAFTQILAVASVAATVAVAVATLQK